MKRKNKLLKLLKKVTTQETNSDFIFLDLNENLGQNLYGGAAGNRKCNNVKCTNTTNKQCATGNNQTCTNNSCVQSWDFVNTSCTNNQTC